MSLPLPNISGGILPLVVTRVFFRMGRCSLVHVKGLAMLDLLGWTAERSCVGYCLLPSGLTKILRAVGIGFFSFF